jgi:hypothetical protein
MHQQIAVREPGDAEPPGPATDPEIREEPGESEGDRDDDGPALRPIRVETAGLTENEEQQLEQEYERIDLTRLEHAVALIAAVEKPAQALEPWQEMPAVDADLVQVRSEALSATWDYIKRSFTRARV